MKDIMMLNPFLLILLVSMVHRSDANVEGKALGKTSWGSWGTTSSCHQSYVNGFQLKVEPSQGGGDGDDTALNGIHLACANGKVLSSSEGPWGDWLSWSYCPSGEHVNKVNYRSEPSQGVGDDSAGNNLNLRCSGGTWLHGGGSDWGGWDSYNCGENGKVCGLQTELEPHQGVGDDTSINRIYVQCCY